MQFGTNKHLQPVRSSTTLNVDMGNYESKTSNNGQTIHPFIYSCQETIERCC